VPKPKIIATSTIKADQINDSFQLSETRYPQGSYVLTNNLSHNEGKKGLKMFDVLGIFVKKETSGWGDFKAFRVPLIAVSCGCVMVWQLFLKKGAYFTKRHGDLGEGFKGSETQRMLHQFRKDAAGKGKLTSKM